MTKPSADLAQASPTKRFSVSMLTRDINLADAILDLLDNCLDGALRLANGGNVDYAQHFVKIELAANHFSIEHNKDTLAGLNRQRCQEDIIQGRRKTAGRRTRRRVISR